MAEGTSDTGKQILN